MSAPQDGIVSHWATLIENFQASPLSFYQAVESAIGRREVPQTQNSRIDYREAGVLSANREYLHITREKLVFDICGAPFGTGFSVSWWLTEKRLQLNPAVKMLVVLGEAIVVVWIIAALGLTVGLLVLLGLVLGGLALANVYAADGSFDDGVLQALPLVGPLYTWLFKPFTFYRMDTMEMFQRAVHNAVLEVIDTMTAEKGVRALSEADRKLIMREFYARKGV